MKGKRDIVESNEAVVGIVVTVLLIGLVLSVTVMINNVYVPQWVEREEVTHMDQVSQQFSQLKYAIDMQSMIEGSTSVSTGITLGNREIPFFNAGRSYGSLTIDPNSCIFTVNWTDAGNPLSKIYSTDSIIYSSGNSYYVDQDYVLQGGALILNQDRTNVLLAKPSIIVDKDINGLITINFTLNNIQGVEGKTAGGGFGTYEVFTQVTESSMNLTKYYTIDNITIETAYPEAWNSSIRRSFFQPGLLINQTVKTLPNKLIITFNEYYPITINSIEIKTEIGFGISNI